MAMRHVTLMGYGNGSSDTTIRKVSLHGYGNGYVSISITETLRDVTGKAYETVPGAILASGVIIAACIGAMFI